MQQVVTPEDVNEAEELSHEKLVIHLLVKRRVEEVNKALQEEWGDLDKLVGRHLTLKHLTREEHGEVVRHYRAAGWKVGMLAGGEFVFDRRAPAWMNKHPYLQTLTLVFAMPKCSIVGKLHGPRDPTKVYENPYSEPRFQYEGGLSVGAAAEEKHTSEDAFEYALKA
jgi:hypothetical protein